jgi:hypothetical protein
MIFELLIEFILCRRSIEKCKAGWMPILYTLKHQGTSFLKFAFLVTVLLPCSCLRAMV